MIELDHAHIELAGTNLIEASAGTGKTYAIACLYLRLLVEHGLTPEQILVVTYTEAATEELRGRIRSRIRDALDAFAGATPQDAFLRSLAGNDNGKGPVGTIARERLKRALSSFDTAAIFTIHGFCRRALQDNAFESGSLYDTELVTDQDPLLQEIVDDFWRLNFFADPAPLLGYALRHGFSPNYFLAFLKKVQANPKLQVIPHYPPDGIAAIEVSCRAAHDRVRTGWQADRGGIVELITSHKGLSRSADAYRSDLLPGLFEEMDSFTLHDNPFDLFSGFDKFSTSGIAKGRKPTGTAPDHAFFELCEELRAQVRERFLALRGELLAFAAQRLPDRKRQGNVRFFDDLINDLYDALGGDQGALLAEALGKRYQAALIDEFQDTDPVQYEIFRTIFAGSGSPLFLIGDPKQAIYSFRGADIFAYLQAADDVGEARRFTLTANWRSTPRLLQAFNTLFENGARPFVFDEIVYHPLKSGQTEVPEGEPGTGGDGAPLQVWTLPPGESGAAPGVGQANEAVPAALAAEIARLLSNGPKGNILPLGRPVGCGDMAVIVRSHRQAALIQEGLREAGIPSVMRSDTSIFASGEAREVLTLLGALADPGSEPKVRAALVTDILGRTGDDIARLLDDEQGWEECLETFRGYHQAWLERGFMVMSRALLAKEGVRGRLLRRPDGERRVTNLLHCFEVIHRACHERGFGIEGLLTWFGERVSGEDRAEEYQIRLETDEKAVKIVTVHVSKGLEYPIVFCPFMWGGLRDDDEVATFHDRFAMVKDFGSSDFSRHRLLGRRECLAESLRLLYVALTRAKFRCYLVAGKISDKTGRNRPETSPLSYLLHASAATRGADDPVAKLAEEVGALPVEAMERQLQGLAAAGSGTIAVVPLPDADAPAQVAGDDDTLLCCREFGGTVADDWRVSSFTSFAGHAGTAGEHPDRDETGAADVPKGDEEPRATSIFTFPRGAQAGIFLHEIFEGLDFARYSADAAAGQVEKGLEKYGYDKEWQPHVCSLVDRVVTTPLNTPEGDFSLAGLQPGCWSTELEFFFPLRFMTSDIMRDCLRGWVGAYEADDVLRLCQALKFRPVQGMVRGFVDMVFQHAGRYYLLDWKSNHLGYRREDYRRDRLKEEMVHRLYPLQYLLYTVALNRYLSLRVPGYDYASRFGGAIYLFLRGMSPEHGEESGVFRDKPPLPLIEELTACLVQAGG